MSGPSAPRLTDSVAARISLAFFCMLGLFLVSTAAAIYVLFEQSRGFDALAGIHFDRAMTAAELTRDAEVVASEVFENMLGVERSLSEEAKTNSNLLRIYDAVRSRLDADQGSPLAEADRWQRPYFDSIQDLRARIYEERQQKSQRIKTSDDIQQAIARVESLLGAGQPAPEREAAGHVLAALSYASAALSTEKPGQIERLRDRAHGRLAAARAVPRLGDQARGLLDDMQSQIGALFDGRDPFIRSQLATLSTARQTRVMAQKLSSSTYTYYQELKKSAREASRRHAEIAHQAIIVLSIFSAIVLGLTSVFVFYIRRSVVQRLNGLSAAMTAHVQGDGGAIPTGGNDEIAAMGHAFEVFVTARSAAEAALRAARTDAEKASQAKSEFLANMSHEIRTPLNAVIGFGTLARQCEPTPEQDTYLSKIQNAAQHLLQVIDDILDFSKIEAGKLELEEEPFDLGEVLDTVSDIVAATARRKGLDLVIAVPADVPRTLYGDSLRLGQVLVNLVGNAVKFTERGEVKLAITAASQDDTQATLHFSVSDTGIGMKPDKLKDLFREFQQADASITRRFGGSGLGLAICKSLVELMGGAIAVESSEGHGSTFHFTLTLRRQPQSGRQDAPLPDDLRDLRVLAADAHPGSLSVYASLLDSFGLAHATVASTGQAVAELRRALDAGERPYGLLILDHALDTPPGQVLEAIPADRRPRLLLAQNVEASAPGILPKPVRASDLFNAILQIFGKPVPPRKARLRPGQEAPPEVAALKGLRVLLAEDHPFNQEIAAKLLGGQGIEVDLADNGRIAVERLERAPPGTYDLIFMDVQMPEMDGYQATRRIRQRFGPAELPIIAMTAHALPEQQAACLEAGMNDHIAKPIDVARLWAVLTRWAPKDRRPMPAPVPPDAPATALSDSPPGFDVPAALRRLCGDRELYDKMLGGFPKWIAAARADLAAAQANPSLEALERASHALIGTSSAIGALALADAARTVESAARARNQDAALALIPTLLAELDRAEDFVARAVPKAPAAPDEGASERLSVTQIDTLRQILTLLEDHDLDATRLFASIKATYPENRIPYRLYRIGQLIDMLEFSEAAARIQEVLTPLDPPAFASPPADHPDRR